MLHLAVGVALLYAPLHKARHDSPVFMVHLDSVDRVRPEQPATVAGQKPPLRQPSAVRPIATEKLPVPERSETRLRQTEQTDLPQLPAEQHTAEQGSGREESGRRAVNSSAIPVRSLPPAESVRSVPTPLVTATRPPTEAVQQNYLQEHFAYIRDLLRKRLVYPPLARKMGWGGRTVVSFTILEDGSVQKIRVTESCGFPLLDKCAVETVKTAAPFPRPPVRADITVPVNFTLVP